MAEREFRIELLFGAEKPDHSVFSETNVGAFPEVEHKRRRVCHGRRLEVALHFPLKKNRLILEAQQECGDDEVNPYGQ
ncbi:hypothetical protein EBY67_03900 [bacterium]|nr:hypothetical protein [bacterium]